MSLPPTSRHALPDGLEICRLPVGLWQVSGNHGRIDPADAVDRLFDYLDAGFSTFDLADHYGPAEDFLGQFRRRLVSERGEESLSSFQAMTKWCPSPGPMTREVVEEAVGVSLARMQTPCLDVLQFHWWEYSDDRYLEALSHLADLQSEGRIGHLALTNFDTEHLAAIVDHGIRVVSNQVQYSLVDRRPEIRQREFCLEHDIEFLAYGTLCGGLLSEKYHDRPEPSGSELGTASLHKYKQMIDRWGGWELFQRLLAVVGGIAERHGVSLSTVAVRAILDQPAVAGVIIGCRLGLSEHRSDSARVFDVTLDDDDRAALDEAVEGHLDLFAAIGDCGDEYRA